MLFFWKRLNQTLTSSFTAEHSPGWYRILLWVTLCPSCTKSIHFSTPHLHPERAQRSRGGVDPVHCSAIRIHQYAVHALLVPNLKHSPICVVRKKFPAQPSAVQEHYFLFYLTVMGGTGVLNQVFLKFSQNCNASERSPSSTLTHLCSLWLSHTQTLRVSWPQVFLGTWVFKVFQNKVTVITWGRQEAVLRVEDNSTVADRYKVL